MKGGKEEDMLIRDPLFPRLHVNDADKSGPRAPPRNKMALYEQLSVPSSQRFTSSARSAPLLLHNSAAMLSNSASSQQNPAYSTEKVRSRSSDGIINANVPYSHPEPKLAKDASSKASSIPAQLSMAAKSISFYPCETFNTKDFHRGKHRDEDDYMVPISADLGIATTMNKEKVLIHSTISAHSNQSAAGTSQRHAVSGCNWSEKLNQSEDKSVKRSGFSGEIKSSTNREAALLEQARNAKSALDQAYLSPSLNGVAILCKSSKGVYPQSNPVLQSGNSDEVKTESRCISDVVTKGDDLKRAREKLNFRESPTKNSEGPNENFGNGKVHSDGANDDDVSETSMVDSVLGLKISPDDVVEVIGPKHFCKARRAIVNQQRIFSVQVFELHRLIEVQKFFAGSPHLLVDDAYSAMPSQKIERGKVFPPSEPQVSKVINKDEPLKTSPNVKRTSDNQQQKPVSSTDCTSRKAISTQAPNCGHCDTRHFQPVHTDGNTPWCFPCPGGQWLVPVLSPSEGLIYKLVPGPRSPNGGLMASHYDSCNSASVLAVAGDISKSVCAFPAFNQHGGAPVLSGFPGYLPPCGLHVVNPTLSGGMASERPDVQTANNSHGQAEFSSADVNPVIPSVDSCNVSVQKGDSPSYHVLKFHGSKDSEFQGSTASTPSSYCERVQEGASQTSEGRVRSLQLFLTPPVGNSDPNHAQDHEHRSGVIKVVPHNARSATESAARIFRSIQKERQQRYDSV